MIPISKIFTVLYFALFTHLALADTMNTHFTSKDTLTLQPADTNHFSGEAAFIRFPTMPSNGDVAPAIVHFEPNGFTDWHAHSQGQYLIVTEGTGRFQEWGKPIQIITQGDVVWIEPNLKHWHGAGEYTAMSHITISPAQGSQVTWMEKAQPEKTESPVKIDKIQGDQLTAKLLEIGELFTLQC